MNGINVKRCLRCPALIGSVLAPAPGCWGLVVGSVHGLRRNSGRIGFSSYGDRLGLAVRRPVCDSMQGWLRGLSFSFFGYYHLLYLVAPAHSLLDPDQAAQLINAIGLVFAGFLALSCSLLLEKLFAAR